MTQRLGLYSSPRGFRYVPSPDKPHVERLELAVTPRWLIFASILLSDRNSADLDWSKDQLTWRHRNKVSLERRFRFNSYHPAPYVSAGVFYQSQYHKWTTTALYAGCLLPAGKHFEFEPYEHQNVTNQRPNQQFNQFGLILNMYF